MGIAPDQRHAGRRPKVRPMPTLSSKTLCRNGGAPLWSAITNSLIGGGESSMRIAVVATAFCLCIIGLTGADVAHAQSANAASAGTSEDQPAKDRLQEVVVTAQKREERLQDVPISIVAISGTELAQHQITGIDDLVMLVPGLAVQDVGVNRRITLRGVSNLAFGALSSTVGIYLDEAAVASTGGTQLNLATYDLQRVEVLRGPQGTLYGEGSLGGTVRFITNSPVLNAFQLTGDVAALFTQNGDPSQRIETMINVPLVDNQLAIRVAGHFNQQGGWVDQPQGNLKNINSEQATDVRAEVLWQATSQLALTATAEIHRDTIVPGAGEDAYGNYTFPLDIPLTPQVIDDYDFYNLTLTYDFPIAKLLSTTTFFSQYNYMTNVGTSFPFEGPPPVPPDISYSPWMLQTTNGFNDELRLSTSGSGRWQWALGLFYRQFEYKNVGPPGYFGQPTPGMELPPAGSDGPGAFFQPKSKAWSIFGDTSYKLTDRLSVGVGVRGYHDDQRFLQTGRTTQTGSFHSVDPRVYANFKLGEEAMVYASAAKGFRSGGFNFTPGFPTFAPETVWTYELGTKMSLWNRRLTINGDVFYSNYTKYVAIGLDPANPSHNIFQNAGDAVIKGLEADIEWRAAAQWTFSLTGDYLDTYFTTINLEPSSSAYNVGDPLDFTPKYQGTLSAQRDFKWNGKSGFARLDYGLQGRSTFRNRSIGPWYLSESDVIHMLNFATDIQWNENLLLGLFAQNLLNDRGFTSPISIEQSSDRARPRTYGVHFSVKF